MSHTGAQEYCNLWITGSLAENVQTREGGGVLARFSFSDDDVSAVFCPPLGGGTWQPDEGRGGPRRGECTSCTQDPGDGGRTPKSCRLHKPHPGHKSVSSEAPWERLVSNTGRSNWPFITVSLLVPLLHLNIHQVFTFKQILMEIAELQRKGSHCGFNTLGCVTGTSSPSPASVRTTKVN